MSGSGAAPSPGSDVAFDFGGRTAIVTGAGGGLGSATVRALLRAGATVLAVDMSQQALVELRRSGGPVAQRLHTTVADVRDGEAVAAYAQQAAVLGGGGVDLFFNNAGVEGRAAMLVDADAEEYRRVLDVNVIGVALGLKEVLARMRPGGAIVNAASTAGLAGAPGVGSYVASKHAVVGLTRTAAIEASVRGVRVNAICPGPVEGRMMRSLDEQRASVLPEELRPPAARDYARPDDVAATVLFLLSDAARLITGQTLLVSA